jgi:tripartite-type tricarboxylate transporter receptor subunit TctC
VNKPGAGGEVGTLVLKDAKPDGYTIGCLGIADNIIIDGAKNSVKLADLDLLGQFVSTPFGIFAKPNSPFKTVQDIIDYAKKNPGKLTFGESGPAVRLYGLMFASAAGIKITTVSFSSGGDSLNAVLGGHVEFALLTPSYNERVRNGKGSVIAVSGKREASYGDIQYLSELGYKLETVSSTPTIVLPKGVSPEIRKIYIDALKKVHEDPAFNAALEKGGYPHAYMIGEEFTKEFGTNVKIALDALKANIDAFK